MDDQQGKIVEVISKICQDTPQGNPHHDQLIEVIQRICQDIKPDVDVQHGPLKIAISGAAHLILTNIKEVLSCFGEGHNTTGTKVLKAMFDQGTQKVR